MNQVDVTVTFKVSEDTDIELFKTSLKKVYDGTAEDEDMSYVLDHVQSVQ